MKTAKNATARDGTTYIGFFDYGAKDGSIKNIIYLAYPPNPKNPNSPVNAVTIPKNNSDHKLKK
jgi:hypothetical protein